MTPIFPQQPDVATRNRVIAFCGLLARPALDDAQRQRLRAMISDAAWSPIPRLTSFHLLEPLFFHHLKRALGREYDEARVFAPRPANVKAAPGDSELVMAYFHRAAILERVLKALAAGNVGKVMLIKGAALAPLYEAPATRQMCDADLVVAPESVHSVRAILAAEGFVAHHHDASEVWHDARSGFHIDLQQPLTALSRRIFDRATPHPSFVPVGNVFLPQRGDHLLLIAMHAARNGGNRVWRDVCDANLLLYDDMKLQTINEAFALAEEFQTGRAAIGALLAFMGEVSPEFDAAGATANRVTVNDSVMKATLGLYRELSTDSVPAVALNLVIVSTRPFSEYFSLVLQRLSRGGKSHGNDSSQWAETDPVMGTIGGGGTLSRQVTKLRLLMQLWRSGQLARYRRLVETQKVVRVGNTIFEGAADALEGGAK